MGLATAGKEMTYAEKLRDPRWQKKRLAIFERDQFTCLDCGSTEKTLHVHHCFYEREPWSVDDKFLLSLCSQCHSDRQTLEDRCRKAIGAIMARLPHREGEMDLYFFVQEAEQIAREEDASPAVRCASTSDWLEDGRWFSAAWENKRLRKCYEQITGRKPKWPA